MHWNIGATLVSGNTLRSTGRLFLWQAFYIIQDEDLTQDEDFTRLPIPLSPQHNAFLAFL
jgi:hypothetical protein